MKDSCTAREPDINARHHIDVQVVGTTLSRKGLGEFDALVVTYECLNCGLKMSTVMRADQ